MGNESRLELAIRTIIETTRAAVRSNQAAGRDELALESARRGDALLDDLGTRLGPDSSGETLSRYDAAQEEMAGIVADASRRALSILDGKGTLDEQVDVGAELRPERP